MAVERFEAVVQREDEGVFVEVPAAVIAALGSGKRPPVVVEVNGYRYPSTPAVYGGRHLLGFRREVREAAGIEVGQTLTVTLELDEERAAAAELKRVERRVGILRPGPKDC
jgi:hypothetical protein